MEGGRGMTPAKLIKALRSTDPYIKDIFTRGGCYRFFLFLKKLFPEAQSYINKDKNHVATLINDRLYDITGEIEDHTGWRRMTKQDIAKASKWSFRQHNVLKIGECPYCEEPLTF